MMGYWMRNIYNNLIFLRKPEQDKTMGMVDGTKQGCLMCGKTQHTKWFND
jgi:hypothetical protein